MNPELMISVLLIIAGIITYALRNRPNPYIGVRFGYTYLSKEAWRKANTFAGICVTILGLILLIISLTLKIPITVFFAILLIALTVLVVLSYKIAKETYEIEDMKTPVQVAKPLRIEGIKFYLTVQIVPIFLYLILTLILWDKIPSRVAIHFDVTGKPDSYSDKFIGAVVIPIIAMCITPLLTFLSYIEPMITRFPALGSKSLVFLTVLQFFIAIEVFLALLYNLNLVSGKVIVAFGYAFIAILLGLIWFVSRR